MEEPEDRGGWAGWLESLERETARGTGEWLDRIAHQVIDRVRLRPGDTVADLGAGTGLLSLKAAREVGPRGRVIAVDSSAACLDVLSRRARDAGLENVTVLEGDLGSIPLGSGSCDCAVCRSALIYTSDVTAALRQMRRILVPAGRYCVFEPLPAESEVVACGAEELVDDDFLLMERTLKEKRSSYSLDRTVLRDAFAGAGLATADSLPLYFTVTMEGGNAGEIAREYLHDLPGELAASRLLEPEFGQERVRRSVERFARSASRGDVAIRIPALLVWGTSPTVK